MRLIGQPVANAPSAEARARSAVTASLAVPGPSPLGEPPPRPWGRVSWRAARRWLFPPPRRSPSSSCRVLPPRASDRVPGADGGSFTVSIRMPRALQPRARVVLHVATWLLTNCYTIGRRELVDRLMRQAHAEDTMAHDPRRYLVLWGGGEIGPFTAEEVRRMVLAGNLDVEAPIRCLTERNWSRVGLMQEFEQLFGSMSRVRVSTTPETPRGKERKA